MRRGEQAAGRELEGPAKGWGRPWGEQGAQPRRGRAQPGFHADPRLLEGAGPPPSGPRQTPVFATGEAAECRAGAHVGGGPCQMLSLAWWPRETPAPGLSLAAASNKEGSGRSGWQEARRALGRPGAGVRRRALRGAQTSLAPASLKAQWTPRALGPTVLGAAGPGKRAARVFPTWFRGIGRVAGSGEPTARGPAARLQQQGLGAQAPRPPKGRLRDTDCRPRGPPRAALALSCQEESGPFD